MGLEARPDGMRFAGMWIIHILCSYHLYTYTHMATTYYLPLPLLLLLLSTSNRTPLLLPQLLLTPQLPLPLPLYYNYYNSMTAISSTSFHATGRNSGDDDVT